MSEIIKRVFTRTNSDGIMETVSLEWKKDSPMGTFSLDANGFKDSSCVETLRGIEDAIGTSTLTMKPESFDSGGEQDVFIVGFGS
jgi:hypothetical protein